MMVCDPAASVPIKHQKRILSKEAFIEEMSGCQARLVCEVSKLLYSPSSFLMSCWSFSCSLVSLVCISRTFFCTTWRTSIL